MASLGNSTINPYQQVREVIHFDGLKDRFPLAYPPLLGQAQYGYSAINSRGNPVFIGIMGQDSFTTYDALLDVSMPSTPMIEFRLVHRKGEQVIFTYYYDPFQAMSMQLTNTRLNQYANASASASSYSLVSTIPPKEEEREKSRPAVPESDYLDYLDIEAAMREGGEVTYAHCQWLLQQEHNTLLFTENTWERWYTYAVEHCPRFAKDERTR